MLQTGTLRSTGGRLLAVLFGIIGFFVFLIGPPPQSRAQAAHLDGSIGEVAKLPPRSTPSSASKLKKSVPMPDKRVVLRTASGNLVHTYPPLKDPAGAGRQASSGAPVVLMLHGMCGDPLASCDYWNRGGRRGSWLVCPSGNTQCGSNWDWARGTDVRAAYLEQVLETLQARYGAHVSTKQGSILMGFSRGAFVARDAVYGSTKGRYRALILIGATIKLDAQRLRQAGIQRIVMACGDLDGARASMRANTARLNAAGIPTRFVSTGRIYHQLPANLEAFARDAIAWLNQAPIA